MFLKQWLKKCRPEKQCYYYARISSEKICISVWHFAEPVSRDDAIAVEGFDTSLIGKKWVSGQWQMPAVTMQKNNTTPFYKNTRPAKDTTLSRLTSTG